MGGRDQSSFFFFFFVLTSFWFCCSLFFFFSPEFLHFFYIRFLSLPFHLSFLLNIPRIAATPLVTGELAAAEL